MQPLNLSHLNRDVRQPVSQASRYEGSTQHSTQRTTSFSPKAPFVAKGHDAQLMEAQQNRLRTHLMLMSGVTFIGTIVKRDKFTITLRHSEKDKQGYPLTDSRCGKEEIFYKHAIESVLIDRTDNAQS